jgi:hypothetical protein
MRNATREEVDQAWDQAKRWFAEHGMMWSDAKYAAISAVGEYILNQSGLSFWEVTGTKHEQVQGQ